MPYTNVPESDWDKMDKCVEQVMAKDSSLEKSNAIAVCHKSIVGKSEKSFIEELIDNILAPFTEKAGARNAKADQERMQKIHDLSVDNGAECPMMIFKEASGKLRWVLFSSSAYKDKDGEIVSLKAQENDCEALDKTGDYGPLRWWHVGNPYSTKAGDYTSWVAGKGLDIGVCDFSAMHGRIRIESGTFYNDRIGARVKEVSDQLSVSLGFSHPETEPESTGGVFEHTHTFERSILPKGKQSNYFASVPIIEKESTMKDSKIERFKSLMGEFADLALGKAEATDKAAEQTGVAFKAKEVDPAEPDADDKATKKMSDMTDGELKAYVKKCMDEMMGDKAKETKEAEESVTLKAINELQATLKSLQTNDEQIANALNQIGTATKANSASIKALQGDLPKSLAHLKRSNAEDNIVSAETAKQHQPKQQTSDGFGSFLDFAVTGQGNGTKPPAG